MAKCKRNGAFIRTAQVIVANKIEATTSSNGESIIIQLPNDKIIIRERTKGIAVYTNTEIPCNETITKSKTGESRKNSRGSIKYYVPTEEISSFLRAAKAIIAGTSTKSTAVSNA